MDTTPTLDMGVLAQWIGRSETTEDSLDPLTARKMQVTLDHAPTLDAGDPLPPFWHYLYFNPLVRASDLGPDGHETLGRFLPPVALPRRMWAGGRIEIARLPQLGTRTRKHSTIRSVRLTEGKTGKLCFVTVDHDITAGGDHCLTETQNIVYRDPPAAGTPPVVGPPAPQTAAWSESVSLDEVALFRYSALIFYGHRVHYDADYTRNVEGYPGLLVHGPLTATLLAGFGLRHAPAGARLRAVDIRAQSPLFARHPFWLEGCHDGEAMSLWARGPDGAAAMTLRLHFDT